MSNLELVKNTCNIEPDLFTVYGSNEEQTAEQMVISDDWHKFVVFHRRRPDVFALFCSTVTAFVDRIRDGGPFEHIDPITVFAEINSGLMESNQVPVFVSDNVKRLYALLFEIKYPNCRGYFKQGKIQ